jgi:transposase
VFGAGPVIAATIIGDVVTVARFPSRDHFAAYNGTAPVKVSSGPQKIYRLSLRGNRRLNHAIHMAAITQIRHQHSDGRAYYERKIAEREDPQGGAALLETADQRRRLRAAARRRPHGGPGRATGEPLCLPGGRLTPTNLGAAR